MNRCLALLLAVAVPQMTIQAAPPTTTEPSFPTGALTIAGEAFAASEVLDARALPDINGKVGIMLTLTPEGAKRLGEITASLIGEPMQVALDGKVIAAEPIRKAVTSGIIEIPGRWNLTDAEALARRISGRDPLPDDLGEE